MRPPEWFQIAGPLGFSSALTIALFWQPRWAHLMFNRLVGWTDGLLSKLS